MAVLFGLAIGRRRDEDELHRASRLADAAKLYYRFASVVRSLRRDVDYEVEEDKRVVVPLEADVHERLKGLIAWRPDAAHEGVVSSAHGASGESIV